ncbi:LysR family transcriptional regulator [Terasakiella sp.]|uniref:LysR family transcriptional regulator n=1 Tax=Terasakiella sp. TaxID=2034861 RepID=UPI003AA89052
MIDDLRALALFVKTVELGSFRECARHFHLSPSVVSHQISDLERRHGVPLLYRTTRKLSLTKEGQNVFDQAQIMVEAAHHALDHLSDGSEIPSGHLVLTMPAGLIQNSSMKRIAHFCSIYPQVALDIRFTDERVDLIEHGIDLALRVGKMGDSTLKSRKIGQIERKLVCSKTYYHRHPTPAHADDLSNWDWIKMKMMPPYRQLIAPDGTSHKIYSQSQIEVDNVQAMYELTCHGLGLSTPPVDLLGHTLKTGDLIEVLPDWGVSSMPVYVVWPQNGLRRRLTSLMLDILTA